MSSPQKSVGYSQQGQAVTAKCGAGDTHPAATAVPYGGSGVLYQYPITPTPLVRRAERQQRRSQAGYRPRIVEIDPSTDRTIQHSPALGMAARRSSVQSRVSVTSSVVSFSPGRVVTSTRLESPAPADGGRRSSVAGTFVRPRTPRQRGSGATGTAARASGPAGGGVAVTSSVSWETPVTRRRAVSSSAAASADVSSAQNTKVLAKSSPNRSRTPAVSSGRQTRNRRANTSAAKAQGTSINEPADQSQSRSAGSSATKRLSRSPAASAVQNKRASKSPATRSLNRAASTSATKAQSRSAKQLTDTPSAQGRSPAGAGSPAVERQVRTASSSAARRRSRPAGSAPGRGRGQCHSRGRDRPGFRSRSLLRPSEEGGEHHGADAQQIEAGHADEPVAEDESASEVEAESDVDENGNFNDTNDMTYYPPRKSPLAGSGGSRLSGTVRSKRSPRSKAARSRGGRPSEVAHSRAGRPSAVHDSSAREPVRRSRVSMASRLSRASRRSDHPALDGTRPGGGRRSQPTMRCTLAVRVAGRTRTIAADHRDDVLETVRDLVAAARRQPLHGYGDLEKFIWDMDQCEIDLMAMKETGRPGATKTLSAVRKVRAAADDIIAEEKLELVTLQEKAMKAEKARQQDEALRALLFGGSDDEEG